MNRLGMTRIIGTIVSLTALMACGGDTGQPAAQSGSASPVAEPATCAGPTRDVPIPANTVAMHDMIWKDNTGRGTGSDPQLVFAFPDIGRICTIRVRFTLATDDGKPAFFQLFWKRRGGEFNERDQHGLEVTSGAQEQTFTANVDANIEGLRIDPDFRPVTFTLAEIIAVTPAGPQRE